MTDTLTIIQRLAATSSKNEKRAILEACSDNRTLQRTFGMALSPKLSYFSSDIGAPRTAGPGASLSLDAALDILQRVNDQKIRGQANATLLEQTQDLLSEVDAEVFRRIVRRDLRCGVASTLVNKVWPELIPTTGFMLASTDPSDIVYPAFSQIKEDGARARLQMSGDIVTLITRTGNDIETHGAFDSCASISPSALSLDGELVCIKDGERLPRHISNGIVNKAIKGTITTEEASLLAYIIWDVEGTDLPYHARWEMLTAYSLPSNVRLVETQSVDSYEEALCHFRNARTRGLEGTILKNRDAVWVPKRTKNLVKFKAEYEAEFRVTGVMEGNGKFAGKVGALMFASEDGLVTGQVGIFKDFPQAVREQWMTELPEIVTIRYNGRISSNGKQSLFLPRVISVRLDKNKADSLEELEQIEKSVDGVTE